MLSVVEVQEQGEGKWRRNLAGMIDHLVYLVHDLEAVAADLGKQLGVSFSPGGRHLNRGTHNVLLRLGNTTYLELLAIDPANTDIPAPRWMGIDLLPSGITGKLSRWALAVGDDITDKAAILEQQLLGAGKVETGSRALAAGGTLRWQLSDPGVAPLVRSLPFLLDWQGGKKPPEMLPDVGCSLRELRVIGMHNDAINFLAEASDPIVYGTGAAALYATIIGPSGMVTLD